MNDDYLFVYGTLRRDSESEMYHLLARYGEFVGDATYQGKLYMVDYYPGVVPSDDPQDVVRGEAYKLTCSDIVPSRLDDYEECGSVFPEPNEYIRRNEMVKLNSGEVITAWIYIFNRSTEGLQLIQSGDFYKIT
jgi:gamma-glutamylcyclotransferase (GGCT)/AIG2-like uncharacterized protein YtfP